VRLDGSWPADCITPPLAASTPSAPAVDGRPAWTIRGLIAAHKLIALAVAGVLALIVAMFLIAALGPKGGAVTDSTSCTQWGSSNQTQQAAYAQRYLREHRGLAAKGASPATVVAAINNNCTQAYGDDVADTTSVAQALAGTF
jgi:hypothetical protein